MFYKFLTVFFFFLLITNTNSLSMICYAFKDTYHSTPKQKQKKCSTLQGKMSDKEEEKYKKNFTKFLKKLYSSKKNKLHASTQINQGSNQITESTKKIIKQFQKCRTTKEINTIMSTIINQENIKKYLTTNKKKNDKKYQLVELFKKNPQLFLSCIGNKNIVNYQLSKSGLKK